VRAASLWNPPLQCNHLQHLSRRAYRIHWNTYQRNVFVLKLWHGKGWHKVCAMTPSRNFLLYVFFLFFRSSPSIFSIFPSSFTCFHILLPFASAVPIMQLTGCGICSDAWVLYGTTQPRGLHSSEAYRFPYQNFTLQLGVKQESTLRCVCGLKFVFSWRHIPETSSNWGRPCIDLPSFWPPPLSKEPTPNQQPNPSLSLFVGGEVDQVKPTACLLLDKTGFRNEEQTNLNALWVKSATSLEFKYEYLSLFA